MCYSNPELLDALLTHLADQMAAYVKYQIESGAQCIQVRGSGREGEKVRFRSREEGKRGGQGGSGRREEGVEGKT